MHGTVILSHGLESGPDASKVSAMAAAASAIGWSSLRPDYRDLDQANGLAGTGARLQRLLAAARAVDGPLVLAGSSFGAFISGLASLTVPTRGLFLLALPLQLPGYAPAFDCAAVPTRIMHGWDDELIPAAAVIEFSRQRRLDLHLLRDSHRLADHVTACAVRLANFLGELA